MRPFIGQIKALSSSRPAVWPGALLSLATGLAFYLATSYWIESDARQRFANHAHNAQNTINARIKSYSDVVRGAASLFQSSDTVTRSQFRDYVAGLSLARHFPAIEVINYLEYVRAPDLIAFERRMRAELAAEMGGTAAFRISPPGQRASYSVLTFIEPAALMRTAGRDIGAISAVAATLSKARDSGILTSSGTPIAVMTRPNHIGLGMRLPVYRRNVPIRNVDERRAAYLGSVGVAFSVNALVKGVLDEMPIKNVRMTLVDSGVDMDISNLNSTARDRLLFDSSGTDQPPLPPLATGRDGGFRNTLAVDFNGRLWKATFSAHKSDIYTRFDECLPWLAMLAGSVSSTLIYALLHSLTSSRRRALALARRMTRELRDSQTKLQLSHQRLRRLAAHADQIKERERKRIAREIHDDLGQNLLALRIEADMLSSRTGERHPHLHERARATLSQIDAIIKSVRQIINDLRPNVLDLGLSAAVEWQVGEFRRRTGIDCELVDDHQDIRLDDHGATAFFRILQDSLSNISRHARASRAKVELKLRDGRLSMTVSDNGIGLQAEVREKIGSFGLVGIEERIHLLGGSCSVISFPGSGTTVCVSVPVHDAIARAGAASPAATSETGVALA
jgi:signal transduction histidine kinase